MTSVCYPTFQINFFLGFTWLPHKASGKGRRGGSGGSLDWKLEGYVQFLEAKDQLWDLGLVI